MAAGIWQHWQPHQNLIPCQHTVLKATGNARTAAKQKAQAKHAWILAGHRVRRASDSCGSKDLNDLGAGAC